MDRFEKIPEVTEHVLSGLKADDKLKHRIFAAAASQTSGKKYSLRTVVVLCSLSVLLILLCVFAAVSDHSSDIQVIPAGNRHSTPPVILENILDKAAEPDMP